MATSSSEIAADAGLTLGEAAAVWKQRRDLLWNAEPEARQLPQEPPQQASAGPVGPGGVGRVSGMAMPGDRR